MSFAGVLSKLPPTDRTTIKKRKNILASTSGVGYQVIGNLQNELRLSDSAFEEIIRALLKAVEDPEALRDAYVKACCQHILEGGAIPKPWPLRYGRAVAPRRFYRTMVELSYFTTERHARRFFRRLLRKSADVAARKLQNKYLGRFLMWATFNPDDLTGDPFEGLPSDADGLRAHLGLDPNERGEDLLLFVYRLLSDVEPLFPTIADAQWGLGFRPVPLGMRWGLTMPWPEVGEEKPCPEVVHKPITGANLTAPIGIVKAEV